MKPLVDTNWGREAELAVVHLKLQHHQHPVLVVLRLLLSWPSEAEVEPPMCSPSR